MGVPELAKRLGVSRQRAHQIVRKDTFPEPEATVGGRPLWRARTIEAWIAAR